MSDELFPSSHEPVNRPPRTGLLANGIKTDELLGVAMAVPDPQVIAELSAGNPRIRYFEIPDATGEGVEPLTDDESTWIELVDLVRTSLARQVISDFPGMQIVTRGIKASINGPIELGDGAIVQDIEDVVANGGDRGADWFRGKELEVEEDGSLTIASMVVANTLNTTELVARAAATGQGHETGIFPAVLVYDASMLEPMGGYTFDPLPGTEPLRMVYILPRPLHIG